MGTENRQEDLLPSNLSSAVVTNNSETNLMVEVDYSFDTNNFFDTQLKRSAFEESVNLISDRLNDDLEAISPSGFNTWDIVFSHPATGETVILTDETIPADTLRVYVGGRPLGGSLGIGGSGGFSASGTSEFIDTVATRGETGDTGDRATATDFGPWGGVISFNTETDWYFGSDPDLLGSNQSDFRSVAAHEFFHVLGFSDSNDSFEGLIDQSDVTFTGGAAIAEHDGFGNPPLNGSNDFSHWEEGLTDEGQEVLMDPTLTVGTRKMPTELDFAALEDIGWDVVSLENIDLNFDIDGNGEVSALTDGILVIWFLAGFTGEALISGAVATEGATRSTAEAIQSYLESAQTMLDVDGNGTGGALTDGILAIRSFAGFTGETLTDGAVAPDATRTTAEEIEAHIEQFLPSDEDTTPPEITPDQAFFFSENLGEGTNNQGVVSFAITSGNDEGFFTINESGFLRLTETLSLNASTLTVSQTVSAVSSESNSVADLPSKDDAITGTEDYLFGTTDDDTLLAQGNQRLFGGAGDDSLITSHEGDHIFYGGSGADLFWLIHGTLPEQANRIVDFELGTDTLGISHDGEIDSFSDLTLEGQNQKTTVLSDDRAIATLKGISASDLSEDDFLFN